jgi:hypothetical protein
VARELPSRVGRRVRNPPLKLDFDPLYNTQDPQITGFRIGEPKIAQNRATVLVRFKDADRSNRLTYHLVKTRQGWKIQNLDYDGGQDLVKILSAPF